MSPAAFRPLVDRDPQPRRTGTDLNWEPDPVLGQRAGEGEPVQSTEGRMGPRFEGGDDRAHVAPESDSQHAPVSPGGTRSFELLSIEALTGPVKIEAFEFEPADGFTFEDEAPSLPADSVVGDPPAADDESGEADEVLDGVVGADDPGADSCVDCDIEAANLDESNAAASGTESPEWSVETVEGDANEQPEALNTESFEDVIEAVPPAPTEPMISESDHLAQLEQVRQATRDEVWGQAHGAGRVEGSAETRQQLKAEHDARCQALDNLIRSIESAACDPIALFGPLRRLSVHLAIELVRGELAVSSEAIGRLIEACLAEIDRSPGDRLILSLHPDDLERWVRRPAIALDRVELRSDPGIGPGSVRLSAGDTVIEDLIEHRLTAIATRVIGESAAQRLPRLGGLKARGFAEGEVADVG